MQRRIFNYDTMEITDVKVNNPVMAVGILFRKFIDNIPHVLLMKYSDPKYNYLDDFGGRTDLEDKHPYDTAIRETLEESNDIINPTEYLKNNKKSYYDSKCKYLCFIVDVEQDFFKDTEVFGMIEKKDNIGRVLDWYKVDEDLYSKVSVRLQNCVKEINKI